MTHVTRRLVGPSLETSAGTVRVVSRVDLWSIAGIAASRHRPVAVEVRRGQGTVLHPIADPGFAVSVIFQLLSTPTIVRRHR